MGDFSFEYEYINNYGCSCIYKVASDPARVIGLNSVGMKNNINEESISLMKKAYKLLYRKNLKIDEAIKKLKNYIMNQIILI